jgi:hypothetical protein
MKQIALLITRVLLLPACAGMEQQMAAMQQQQIDTYCNTEGAYQKGYNDGHESGRMDNSFVAMCPTNQDGIRVSYREGFDKGAAVRASEPRPVEVHVVQDNGTPPQIGWECHDYFGEQVCGYHCQEAYGQLKCAHSYSSNCVAAFGAIKCGLHCREEYGNIVCDRYE